MERWLHVRMQVAPGVWSQDGELGGAWRRLDEALGDGNEGRKGDLAHILEI